MTRYRWKMPTKHGRWLDTKDEALEAAIKAGFASRDEHTNQIYRDPFLEVEEKE